MFRRTFVRQYALVHQGHIGTGTRYITHDVGGKNDDHILVTNPGKQVPETDTLFWVQTSGRLIDNDQLWIAYQRLSDTQSSFHPAGEVVGKTVTCLVQAYLFQHFVDRILPDF